MSNRYTCSVTELVLPAASRTVTDNVQTPSAPARSKTSSPAAQATVDVPPGPDREQENVPPASPVNVSTGLRSFDGPASPVSTGAAGAVVSNRYFLVVATLVLLARSVTVTTSVHVPSAPTRFSVRAPALQVTAFEAPLGPTRLQPYTASASPDSVNVGVRLLEGPEIPTTPGAAGAAVSSRYVTSVVVLVLPAAEETFTRSVQVPSGPAARSSVSAPALHVSVRDVLSGAMSVQFQLPELLLSWKTGLTSLEGPDGPVTDGAGGGAVSSTYVRIVAELVLPATSRTVTLSVHMPSEVRPSCRLPAMQPRVVVVTPSGAVSRHVQIAPSSPASVKTGFTTLDGPAAPVTTGAAGGVVSSRYGLTVVALVLSAASVTVTRSVQIPSLPARDKVVPVLPQGTSTAAPSGSVSVQLTRPSASTTKEKPGVRLFSGPSGPVTPGAAGAVVSSRYLCLVALLVLRAASRTVTDNVQTPSAPTRSRTSSPAAQVTVDVPPGPVRVQVNVPPASPVSVSTGLRSFDGPAAPTTPGAAGAVVSNRYLCSVTELVLPAASRTVTDNVQTPSAPVRSRTSSPAAQATVDVPPGPDRLQVNVPPASPVNVSTGLRSFDGPAAPVTPGAAGAVVSNRYTCSVALVLPAVSVTVTVSTHVPSAPARARSCTPEMQSTAEGEPPGAVRVQERTPPGSAVVRVTSGERSFDGPAGPVTPGASGATVSSSYVCVVEVLGLPATSVTKTDSTQAPSAPATSSVTSPAAQAIGEGAPPGAVRVQVKVPPVSPLIFITGARSFDGPTGPVTPGAAGATVSRW